MSYDVGLLLDGLILVFLSVTIFYAARLSLFLKSFRQGKEGMQTLIRDLSVTVDKAEQSIAAMKVHAQQTEGELHEIINEAKFLSDELRFMNETGDSLADRLGKLADRNRELVDLMENAGGIGSQKSMPQANKSVDPWEVNKSTKKSFKPAVEEQIEDSFEISDFDVDEDDERDFWALGDGAYREEDNAHKSKVNTEAKSKLRSFAIFDRDHMEEHDDDIQIKDDLAFSDSDSSSDQFHSQAEQDLYDALQRKKRVNQKVNETT